MPVHKLCFEEDRASEGRPVADELSGLATTVESCIICMNIFCFGTHAPGYGG